MKSRHHSPYGTIGLYRPESTSSSESVLIVPGYSESLTHNKKLVDTLAKTGYDAFTFTQPRRRGKTGLTDPIVRQGDIVLKALDIATGEGDKIHAVAHSMGCAAVLYAALQAPERFASIMLMQPLGMVGEQSFGELLGRVNKKVARNTVGPLRGRHLTFDQQEDSLVSLDAETRLRYSARVARAQLAGGGILAKHPRLAIQEAKAAGKYDISEDIQRISGVGVPVHLVVSRADEMFDQDKVEASYANIADHVASYRPLVDASASHDTFWLHPERSAYVIDQTIQHP